MFLKKSELINGKNIQISGSKSISNRLLILGKLFGKINIQNLSSSQDTDLLKKALDLDSEIVNIHHAGTAMRFLTSYFSIIEGKKTILTGSERMKNRPIKPLVDALKNLGAEINYLEKAGFPPLEIIGKKLKTNSVKIEASISSQFLTSLILIGSRLENGLTLELIGKITSLPYLEMTLKILDEIGIKSHFSENKIEILPYTENLRIEHYEVESDWSSASYFYSLAAIGRKSINLKSYQTLSLQGDSMIKEIYWNFFGINTVSDYAEKSISLFAKPIFEFPRKIFLNMNNCPDIVQTLCVTASALKIPFEITGLRTLKIKETDRLAALQNELLKIGAKTCISDDKIELIEFTKPDKNISIATYDDHRMAMSFAPFALIKGLNIENEDVVEKSYPEFWKDFFSVIM